MKVKLETKKFGFNQALAILTSDKDLSAKMSFKIKYDVRLDEDEELNLKLKIPNNLKELLKKENKDVLKRLNIKISAKQFSISSKNKKRDSHKKHIVERDNVISFSINKGKIKPILDSQEYFDNLKSGQKLLKKLNYKNLKNFLKLMVRDIEFEGEFKY